MGGKRVTKLTRAFTDAGELGSLFGVKLAGAFAPDAVVKGKITEMEYEGLPFELVVDRIEPQRPFSWRWHPYAVASIRQVPEAGPGSSGQDGADNQRPEIIGIRIAGVRIIPCDGIVLL